MSDQNNELLELRAKVVDQMQKLALGSSGDAETRLQLLMEMARAGKATTEVYHAVYEIVSQIPNDDDKMNAMLDLLYELDRAVSISSESLEEHAVDSAQGLE